MKVKHINVNGVVVEEIILVDPNQHLRQHFLLEREAAVEAKVSHNQGK